MNSLFFGAGITAPWPSPLLSGRIVEPTSRHVTLAFLGAVPYAALEPALPSFPKPPFLVGIAGVASALLLLPQHTPRVVALQLDGFAALEAYQNVLHEWLEGLGYSIDKRPFLPHVTLARRPFATAEWRAAFSPLPIVCSALHLYESAGDLQYRSLWLHPLVPPFEEMEHVADIAFRIRGQSVQMMHLHAQTALAFVCPALLPYFRKQHEESLDAIIIELNEAIAKADEAFGCPFKAVSFHGQIVQESAQILQWEMLVDV